MGVFFCSEGPLPCRRAGAAQFRVSEGRRLGLQTAQTAR